MATRPAPAARLMRISGLVQPGEVDVLGRPAALGETQPRQRSEGQADGHVQPEDPLPADSLDDGAADDRAHRYSESADAAPRSQREAAPARGHCRAQDGQRQRGHDRRARALQRTRCDQRTRTGSQRCSRRSDGEHGQSDREEQAPSKAVTERCTRQQQHGKGQGVGVDGPFQLLQVGVEVAPDHRQCRGDHQVVEGHHEQCDRRDGKSPDGAGSDGHRRGLLT
jgi:hypothetical protein